MRYGAREYSSHSVTVCCNVLQCVAMCCNVLQCVARLSNVQVLLETHLRYRAREY